MVRERRSWARVLTLRPRVMFVSRTVRCVTQCVRRSHPVLAVQPVRPDLWIRSDLARRPDRMVP